MTRLNIACTAFASFGNAHLFTTPEDTIRQYYNRITRANAKQHAIRNVCGQVSKAYSFTPQCNVDKIIRQIRRKHKLNLSCARSIYFKCRGVAVEPKCRQLFSAFKKHKISRIHEKCTKTFDVFDIQGEIDGVCDGHVVELKARMGRFSYEPPFHDIVQLACYCVCLQLPGILAEYDKNFKLRSTELTLARAEEILENLLSTVRKNVFLLYKCLEFETSDLTLIWSHMEPF